MKIATVSLGLGISVSVLLRLLSAGVSGVFAPPTQAASTLEATCYATRKKWSQIPFVCVILHGMLLSMLRVQNCCYNQEMCILICFASGIASSVDELS